ncbi:MAG TPA: pentapeptide repeat-containing protein, partial [Rhodoglobus sp.]|nr:pentapeptide repeat-containing protein [Rhodoglobus sp.]
RRLHELLWYLDCAIAFTTDDAIGAALAQQFESVRRLTAGEPAAVRDIDTDVLYDEARPLLVRASAAHRGTGTGSRPDRRIRPGADLVGADLRRADLRAADLRGALLIAADLRGVDLSRCDLLGVDLRDANVGGADLTAALFLTQPQVSAAIGDAATLLPEGFDRPAHWERNPLI